MFTGKQGATTQQLTNTLGQPLPTISQTSTERLEPHVIPTLLLLDHFVDNVTGIPGLNFEKTVFVGVQHILETTATLFKTLIRLGAKPEQMYFIGKCYSTSPAVALSVQQLGINLLPTHLPAAPGKYRETCQEDVKILWGKVAQDLINKHTGINTIIIIDDGGRCLEEMPSYLIFSKYRIAGVEQTRGGLYSPVIAGLPFPIIAVASSATKRLIESPFIATAVITRLQQSLSEINVNETTVVGIIGNGAIGDSIKRYFLGKNAKVLVYDPNSSSFAKPQSQKSQSSFFRMLDIKSVIINSNIIFGCTGQDITENVDVIELSRGNKLFISCTSEDKEFLSLLTQVAQSSDIVLNPYLSTLDDISFKTKHGAFITIKSGGFPINFDRRPWNVPAEDIALTQALMLGSCLQAQIVASAPIPDGETINQSGKKMLDARIQYFTALTFAACKQLSLEENPVLSQFQSLDYISQNSEGSFETSVFDSLKPLSTASVSQFHLK